MEEAVLVKGRRMGCGHLVAKRRRVFGENCWDCQASFYLSFYLGPAPTADVTSPPVVDEDAAWDAAFERWVRL